MTSGLRHESLDRGITVIELLAQNGACSLADLHRLSGISKSSIRRLLGTLVERRLVRRSQADGLYRTGVTLPVSAGEAMPGQHAWLADVAMPVVAELTRQIEWPSDLQVVAGERMRILDSTRPLSPFHLYRGVVNREVNIFGSAAGMCCLAGMGDDAFRRIAAHTHGDPKWGLDRYRMTEESYLPHLDAARSRGYGTRLAAHVGETVFDDGLAAIARPLVSGDTFLGAVSLLWPKRYLDAGSFAAKYLPALRDATDGISRLLSEGRKDLRIEEAGEDSDRPPEGTFHADQFA